MRADVVAILRRGGIETCEAEARWILEAAGLPARTGGPSGAGEPDAEQIEPRALSMARRRAGGEPLQYLTGVTGFRTIELAVGPGVLVPRPETEIVAEVAISRLPTGGTLVDVGTGSGAMALAIKTERSDATVVATEVSEDASRWARINIETLGLDVGLLTGDLFDPLPVKLRGRVDVIVSNPPYVSTGEADDLPSDVVEHEPHRALFAGPDGLSVIRRLGEGAPGWLRPGGALVLEIGAAQGAGVRGILGDLGYREIEIRPDLAGRDRIAIATCG